MLGSSEGESKICVSVFTHYGAVRGSCMHKFSQIVQRLSTQAAILVWIPAYPFFFSKFGIYLGGPSRARTKLNRKYGGHYVGRFK